MNIQATLHQLNAILQEHDTAIIHTNVCTCTCPAVATPVQLWLGYDPALEKLMVRACTLVCDLIPHGMESILKPQLM